MHVHAACINVITGRGYNGGWAHYLIMVGAHAVYTCECANVVMATVCSSMLWVTLTVLLVFSSYSWTPAGGQTCTISGNFLSSLINSEYCSYTKFSLYTVTVNAAAQFTLSTVNASAESVDGSTPAARVTWSTTAPPQCVAAVRVEFRNNSLGPVVATYTTTNTSQTEVIQTDLQCDTDYYIAVVVTGATSDGQRSTVRSSSVRVLIGGKEIVGIEKLHLCYMIMSYEYCTPSWKAKWQGFCTSTSNVPL